MYLFLIRSKTNAARAEDQSLRYVLQARLALDGSEYQSQLSMLPNSGTKRLDSSLKLMDLSAVSESSIIDLVWYAVRNCAIWKFHSIRRCLAKKKAQRKKFSGLHETEAKCDESNTIPKTKHAFIVESHESTS